MNNEQVIKALRLMVVWSSCIGIAGIPIAYFLGRQSMKNKTGEISAKVIKQFYEDGLIVLTDPTTGQQLSPSDSEYILNELILNYTT